jgi:hypothetical protein
LYRNMPLAIRAITSMEMKRNRGGIAANYTAPIIMTFAGLKRVRKSVIVQPVETLKPLRDGGKT